MQRIGNRRGEGLRLVVLLRTTGQPSRSRSTTFRLQSPPDLEVLLERLSAALLEPQPPTKLRAVN